jgi:hypothetical protein
LGEHGEEAGQKITEMEALCQRLREVAHKLKEEKTKLEGMVESHDELVMEITKKIHVPPWVRMPRMKMRMRMTMMEETPLHPLLLRHPLSMCPLQKHMR